MSGHSRSRVFFSSSRCPRPHASVRTLREPSLFEIAAIYLNNMRRGNNVDLLTRLQDLMRPKKRLNSLFMFHALGSFFVGFIGFGTCARLAPCVQPPI